MKKPVVNVTMFSNHDENINSIHICGRDYSGPALIFAPPDPSDEETGWAKVLLQALVGYRIEEPMTVLCDATEATNMGKDMWRKGKMDWEVYKEAILKQILPVAMAANDFYEKAPIEGNAEYGDLIPLKEILDETGKIRTQGILSESQTLFLRHVDCFSFFVTHIDERGKRCSSALLVDFVQGREELTADPYRILLFLSPPLNTIYMGELHVCRGEVIHDAYIRRMDSLCQNGWSERN